MTKKKKKKVEEPAPQKKKARKKVFKAFFVGNIVYIKDGFELARAEFFEKSGFGEVHEGRLELSLVESLHLLQKGRLRIYDYKKKKLDFNLFIRKSLKFDRRFFTRFKVFDDIRTRGYVVKTALKYGADFRVYDRGAKPGQEHARWILHAVSEQESFDWKRFAAMNRVAHSVRKRLMIGVLDSEGDVTFYEIRWMRP